MKPKRLEHIIEHWAKVKPDRTCLVFRDKAISFKTLSEKANGLAHMLLNDNLGNGKRVGILTRDPIDFTLAFFAIHKAHATAVPLNAQAKPHVAALDIQQYDLNGVYTDALYLDACRAMEKKEGSALQKVYSIQNVQCMNDSNAPDSQNANDPAVILMTSGTTGKPLGVVLSHKNLIANAMSVSKSLCITEKDIAMFALPLHHTFGLSALLCHLLSGSKAVIESSFAFPVKVLEQIEKENVSWFYGVPSHFKMLLDQAELEKKDIPSLRNMAQAGDRMPQKLTQRILDMKTKVKFFMMYGQTEAGPRLTCLDPNKAFKKMNSVGASIAGVEIRILKEDGSEANVGEEGEVVAKGDGIMVGYWKDPKKSEEALRDGWLHTGDLGYKDKDGDLFLVGRKNPIFKIGGQRVHAEEIMQWVRQCEGVEDVVIKGICDELLGTKMELYVSGDISKIDKEQIMNHLKKHLPDYKIPAQIHIGETIHEKGI